MEDLYGNEGIWRLLILDISNTYTQIYDEIYGDDIKLLHELLDAYSDASMYKCICMKMESY